VRCPGAGLWAGGLYAVTLPLWFLFIAPRLERLGCHLDLVCLSHRARLAGAERPEAHARMTTRAVAARSVAELRKLDGEGGRRP